MECYHCKKEFNYAKGIPLVCNCGLTLCKQCILDHSILGTFKCPSCNRSNEINKLVSNRGMDIIINEVKSIKQAKAIKENRKGRIMNIKNLESQGIISEIPYQALKDCGYVCVEDKSISAVPETENRKNQTGRKFILLQKLNEKRLCVNIV